MADFLARRDATGKPFQCDENSVLLFIDLSGSTRYSESRGQYDRVVFDVIDKETRRPGVSSVLYAFWGSELLIADDERAAMEICHSECTNGTSAELLVTTAKSVPGVESARIVVVTDGEVPTYDIRRCAHHRFREVYFLCVELYSGSTDRSLPMLFDNSASLSIEYVNAMNDTRDIVLLNYDGGKADETVESFGEMVDAAKNYAESTGEPPVFEHHLAPLKNACGALYMALFDRPDRFHAVRERVSAAMQRMKAFRDARQDARVVERLADLRGASANEAFDDAVKFLRDLLSKLGSSVTSTCFVHDRAAFKAPGLLERSGVKTQDTSDKAASSYASAYLKPCAIIGDDEAVEHVLPLASLPEDLVENENFIREPLAFVKTLAQIGVVMPPMSVKAFREWVVVRGNYTHPVTRGKIGGALPLYADLGPEEVRVLRSQIAHAFFGGKMVGPWSRFLAAIYLTSKGCAFVPSGVVDALLDMTCRALIKDTGPVTGSPLISFPSGRSSVLLSFQFKLLSRRLGFRGESDVFRSVLMFPGLARNVLELLRDVRGARGADAWDPEMAAVDEEELERTIDAYESYATMYRVYGKHGEKGVSRLMRTLWQAYEIVDETIVFFSGPGDDRLVREKGIRCPPGLAYALYVFLMHGMNRKKKRGVGSAPVHSNNNSGDDADADEDLKRAYLDGVREMPLPLPVVLEADEDKEVAYAKESSVLCPETCRPRVPSTGKPFSRADAQERYGRHFLSAHNWYGLLVCRMGRFPTEDEMLAYAAKRTRTQSGDDSAVLPARARDVLRVAMREFAELRKRCPALENVTEFARRFRESTDPEKRFAMQEQQQE